MKTKEEIEKLADERYDVDKSLINMAVRGAFKQGFQTCQELQEKEIERLQSIITLLSNRGVEFINEIDNLTKSKNK